MAEMINVEGEGNFETCTSSGSYMVGNSNDIDQSMVRILLTCIVIVVDVSLLRLDQARTTVCTRRDQAERLLSWWIPV